MAKHEYIQANKDWLEAKAKEEGVKALPKGIYYKVLTFTDRRGLREWLERNHLSERCCWVACNRSKMAKPDTLPYLEIVEEALCFGWIDSTLKKLPDGRLAQRLSPRRKGSHWTELNRQRCLELEHRGLMTEYGRKALKEDVER